LAPALVKQFATMRAQRGPNHFTGQAGTSKSTIGRAIKSGRMSATRDRPARGADERVRSDAAFRQAAVAFNEPSITLRHDRTTVV
jgi:hypothetical protein